jgi:hypothetical protein
VYDGTRDHEKHLYHCKMLNNMVVVGKFFSKNNAQNGYVQFTKCYSCTCCV